MAEYLDIETSVTRLVVLEKQMNELDETFKRGKLSLDAYNKSLTVLESESDVLSSSLLKQGVDVDKLTAEYRKLSSASVATTSEMKKGMASARTFGRTARASFGMLSSSIRTANPLLSTCFVKLRALTPAVTQFGVAAQEAGGMLKAAMSPTGVALLLTAIVSLTSVFIKHFDEIGAAMGMTEGQIDNLKSKWNSFWQSAVGILGGVGNVLVQSLVNPIKGILEAVDIVKDKGVKGIGEAAKAMGGAWLDNFNVVDHFKEGKVFSDKMIAGIREGNEKNKPKVKDSIADMLNKAISDAYASVYNEMKDMDFLDLDGLDEAQDKLNEFFSMIADDSKNNLKVLGEWNARFDTEMDKEINAINLKKKAYIKAGVDEAEATEWAENEKNRIRNEYLLEEQERIAKEDAAKQEALEREKKRLEEEKKHRLEVASAALDATANLTEGLASLYESDEKNAKKNAKKIKGLKIATAIIDMYSGATKAFMQAQELGPIAGPIIGATNAAACIATGIANINKIKSTSEDGSSSVSPSVSATPVVTQTYTLNKDYSTSEDLASLRDSLNAQKVVLVVDDVTKVQDTSTRVQTQASF